MKMSITAFGALPSTSRARLLDVVANLEKVFKDHKCEGVNFTLGIVPAESTVKGKDNDGNEQAGQRTERGQAAADDFGGDEPGTEAGGDDGKPGRKPRSDAGKPRGKRGAAEGTAAEGPERGAGRAEAGDAAGGNGSRRAPRGGDEGRGEGREVERGGEGGGGRTGRARDGDGKAAEVEAADEDWGSGGDDDASGDFTNKPAETDPEFDSFEEGEAWWAKTPDTDGWPDSLMPEGPLNRGALSTIMSDHFRANGGKSKKGTFDLLAEVTGAEDLNKVHADDFDKLARAMLRDTAKLRHGVKKPGAK